MGLDVRGPKNPAVSRYSILLTGCPDKKSSLVVASVRLWNELLVWMSTTGDMFGGQYIPEPCGSVGMVVLAKYGKPALTSAF